MNFERLMSSHWKYTVLTCSRPGPNMDSAVFRSSRAVRWSSVNDESNSWVNRSTWKIFQE